VTSEPPEPQAVDEQATDPQATDEVAEPQGSAASAGSPGDAERDAAADAAVQESGGDEEDELTRTGRELAERTADLQRLQAEFLNYKRRVERDRDLVRENAVFAVLSPMLDVLDSIDRAREAGELEGGFKGVADQLERIVSGLGLSKYGEPGDPFDPTHHEALSHVGTDPDVDVVTCKHIAKAGYRIGDRVVRAAQVLVVDPEPID
jgi:molecular chaperone GrpE